MVVILHVRPVRSGSVSRLAPRCQPADYVSRELANGTNLMLVSRGPTAASILAGALCHLFPGSSYREASAFRLAKDPHGARRRIPPGKHSVVIVLMERRSSSR